MIERVLTVWQHPPVEIDRLETLRTLLEHAPHEPPPALAGLRLQDLDLHTVEDRLLARTDLAGLVVLGGRLSPTLTVHLVRHGAIVFPSDPAAPLDVYRSRLYTPAELYAGLQGPGGYADTPDHLAYAWTLSHPAGSDAYVSMLRAIHDESITDALDERLRGHRVVGIMGGHGFARGCQVYADAARLGHALAGAGRLVATGGGPGAMEAANLGALAPDPASLDQALAALAAVPSYRPDVAAWARTGLDVRARLVGEQPAQQSIPLRSIGIPTWFYGHEPPNVFGQGIAKYFSNALREDQLVARCNAGIVVLPGAAGTVQELFQISTRLYYERCGDGPLPSLVLVGRDQWTRSLPAWPLLHAVAGDRPMRAAIHLVDTVEQAAALLSAGSRDPAG